MKFRSLRSSTNKSAKSCFDAYQRLDQPRVTPVRNAIGLTFCPIVYDSLLVLFPKFCRVFNNTVKFRLDRTLYSHQSALTLIWLLRFLITCAHCRVNAVACGGTSIHRRCGHPSAPTPRCGADSRRFWSGSRALATALRITFSSISSATLRLKLQRVKRLVGVLATNQIGHQTHFACADPSVAMC